MGFTEKYKSKDEADYLVFNPKKDKDGKVIQDQRTTLSNDTYALVEALNEIKSAILRG